MATTYRLLIAIEHPLPNWPLVDFMKSLTLSFTVSARLNPDLQTQLNILFLTGVVDASRMNFGPPRAEVEKEILDRRILKEKRPHHQMRVF